MIVIGSGRSRESAAERQFDKQEEAVVKEIVGVGVGVVVVRRSREKREVEFQKGR